MRFHPTGFHRGGGRVVGDVDKGASLVGADLVKEDWGAITKNHMAMVRERELGIDEFEAPEFRLRGGQVAGVLFTKFGGVAIGYDSERTEEKVRSGVVSQRFDAEDV